MFNITGVIKKKFPEQQVSEKFRKRDFVLTDNSSQYPQHITFQLVQDRCSLIDGFNEGQEVKVFFNLRGREYTDKRTNEIRFFNTIEAWKIEGGAGQQQQAPAATSAPMPDITTFSSGDQNDDLPF